MPAHPPLDTYLQAHGYLEAPSEPRGLGLIAIQLRPLGLDAIAIQLRPLGLEVSRNEVPYNLLRPLSGFQLRPT